MCSLSRARPPMSKTTAIGSTFWRRACQASLNSLASRRRVPGKQSLGERSVRPGARRRRAPAPAALRSSTCPSRRSQKSTRRAARGRRFGRARRRWLAAGARTARGCRRARADGAGGPSGIAAGDDVLADLVCELLGALLVEVHDRRDVAGDVRCRTGL